VSGAAPHTDQDGKEDRELSPMKEHTESIPIEEEVTPRKLSKTQIRPPYFPTEKAKKQRRRKYIMIGLGILITFLIAAIACLFKIRLSPNQNTNNISIMVAPTMAPRPIAPKPHVNVPCAEELPEMYIHCICLGTVSYALPAYHKITAENIKQELVSDYLPPSLFTEHLSTCNPLNVALAWLAEDLDQGEIEYSPQDNRVRLLLGAFFAARKGHGWIESTNWFTNAPVCQWYGIKCIDDTVVAIEMPDNSPHLMAPLPPELFQLTNLKLLELANNSITGVLPSEFFRLTNLVYVDMENNYMSGGTIGSELGLLSELGALKLNNAGEGLVYTLTSEIANLLNLGELSLANCTGVGTIPSEISALTNVLEDVDLSGGGTLSGTIPTEIGQLKELRNLKLGGNQLDSTIPTELGELRHLEFMDLGKNLQIHGTIPIELGRLMFLKHLRLRETGLTGSLPSVLSLLGRMRKSLRIPRCCVYCIELIKLDFASKQNALILKLAGNF